MTKTEQNLRLLILKAIELGYIGYIYNKGFCGWVATGCGDLEVYSQPNKLIIRFEDGDYSINDLVLNNEEGELSFLDALTQGKDLYPSAESLRLHWVLLPASQRLGWLFETFSEIVEEPIVHRFEVGEKCYILSRDSGYVERQIVSLVKYKGQPAYEFDRLVTINKSGDKVGSASEEWVEGVDVGMIFEEGFNVCPCFEQHVFKIGDKCHETPMDMFFGNLNVVLTEDMVNK